MSKPPVSFGPFAFQRAGSTKDLEDLYRQMILDHNKKPRNFRILADATHQAEGFNPLCGDHLWVYLAVDARGDIADISFQGSGCAISKASASLMTTTLKSKNIVEARRIFGEFHQLVQGRGSTEAAPDKLGSLKVFAGIWQYPARVKCAVLAWHAMNAALEQQQVVSTE